MILYSLRASRSQSNDGSYGTTNFSTSGYPGNREAFKIAHRDNIPEHHRPCSCIFCERRKGSRQLCDRKRSVPQSSRRRRRKEGEARFDLLPVGQGSNNFSRGSTAWEIHPTSSHQITDFATCACVFLCVCTYNTTCMGQYHTMM